MNDNSLQLKRLKIGLALVLIVALFALFIKITSDGKNQDQTSPVSIVDPVAPEVTIDAPEPGFTDSFSDVVVLPGPEREPGSPTGSGGGSTSFIGAKCESYLEDIRSIARELLESSESSSDLVLSFQEALNVGASQCSVSEWTAFQENELLSPGGIFDTLEQS